MAESAQIIDFREKKNAFVVIFFLVILSWLSIKVVLPALPYLPDVFHCPAHGIKISVSVFLLAYSLSQPFWGSLGQKKGMLLSLYLGLGIGVAGSVISMLADSLPVYIIGRGLEGVGIGNLSPISRALLTKLYNRQELARRMAVVSGIASLMPAISPIIGGWIMAAVNWRAIFGLLGILSLGGIFFSRLWLTPACKRMSTEKTIHLDKAFGTVLTSRHFWVYVLIYAAMTGGLIGYYSASPFWFASQLGMPEKHYTYLLLPTAGLYLAGLLASRSLIKNFSAEKIVSYGIWIALSVSGLVWVMSFTHVPIIYTLILTFSLFGIGAGLIFPIANSYILSYFRVIAPIAAATTSSFLFAFSSLTSYFAMNIQVKSEWQVPSYLLAMSIIATVSWMNRPSGDDNEERSSNQQS